MGLTRSYSGASSQQHQWTEDAINDSSFPWDRITLNVEFSFESEQSLQGAGHFDKDRFLFGQTDSMSGGWRIRIWNQLDTTGHEEYEGKDFFEETIIHELAHALQFTYIEFDGERTTLDEFYHDLDGHKGTLSDYEGGAAWEDRIKEAFAEFFKDVYFDGRKFDNRTNWHVELGDFVAWLDFVGSQLCAGSGGGYEDPGSSNMPGPGGFVYPDHTQKFFQRIDGVNPMGFYDPAQIDFSKPWLAVLPHLDPLTRVRDNADIFGLDPDNLYVYSSDPPVTFADLGYSQDWADWPWSDPTLISLYGPAGAFSFSLNSDTEVFGSLHVDLDAALPDPDGVLLSIDTGGGIPTPDPTGGGSGVAAYVPSAFARSVTGEFEGLYWDLWRSGLHNFIGPVGPLPRDSFSGGTLAPLKGGCDPLAGKWPYAPHEYELGTPQKGHILHPRPVHGRTGN